MSAINAVPKNMSKPITHDILTAWLEHVAGVGSPIEIKLLNGGTHTLEPSPHYFTDCETCKQIAEYLARYHGESEQ